MRRWQVTVGLGGLAAAAALLAPRLQGPPELCPIPAPLPPEVPVKPTVCSYLDSDGDGFGASPVSCGPQVPQGYVLQNGDCDNERASRYPGAPEVPGDGIDQDCDGRDLPGDPHRPLIPELQEPPPVPALPPEPEVDPTLMIACGLG